MAVDITVTERIEEGGLLLLVPHAAIDDQIDAVQQCLGEAGGSVGALLVAIVERCCGAAAVGDELIDADGRIDDSATRESQLLVIAGESQERGETGRGVVEVSNAVALVERIVDPIAVGLD